MNECPILFGAPMVRAILAGTKTQTRRIVKPQPPAVVRSVYRPFPAELNNWQGYGDGLIHWYGHCAYGVPGDRLYVKEAWRASSAHNDLPPRDIPIGDSIEYCADPERIVTGRYRHARFMMRWMSRITLEITDVRVERLQDIDDKDARREGAEQIGDCEGAYVAGYRRLWDQINGAGSWALNPWVWVIAFKRVS